MSANAQADAGTQLSGAAEAEASGAASHHSSEGNGPHSFGGQVSPRAARSQVSTAVSFEGARAAGSAALPSRSLEEESALSAAEGDVECSHSADPNQAAPGHSRPARGRLPRPSNSLISTAVQPASPHGHVHQQPVSPKLNRANSVVSHTAPGGRAHGRAGTPASLYGQGHGFLLPTRARQLSPARLLGAEQGDAVQPAQNAPPQQQPAWQHMPPAFPALQDLGGGLAAHQPGLPHVHQHHGLALRMEHRDSFDGHHRSSDNGGGRHQSTACLVDSLAAANAAAGPGAQDGAQHVPPGLAGGAVPGQAGLMPTSGAAAVSGSAAAVGVSTTGVALCPAMRSEQHQQQHHEALQSHMQLFQHALASLPGNVLQQPAQLLESVLGQQVHPTSGKLSAAGACGSHAAGAGALAPNVAHQGAGSDMWFGQHNASANAAADAIPSLPRQQQVQLPPSAGPCNSSSNRHGARIRPSNPEPAGPLPPGLLQQLQAQMTPALLAVLQQQQHQQLGETVGRQAAGPPPGQVVYSPQQLQSALSLLLASLASQATGQYGLGFPAAEGSGGGVAASHGGGLQAAGVPHLPTVSFGMLPPPIAQHAKSCDSSIQGERPARNSSPAGAMAGINAAPAAGAAAHSSISHSDAAAQLNGSHTAAAAIAAAAAAAAVAAAAGGVNNTAAAGQPQQLSQQHEHSYHQLQPNQPHVHHHTQQPQHAQWRSPSPSPAPAGHTAARTSAAGEGHGSVLNLGAAQGGYFLPSSQLAGDAVGGAVSSAGGASRAGGGITSEEGEAEAEVPMQDAADGGSYAPLPAPSAGPAGGVLPSAFAGDRSAQEAGGETGSQQQLQQEGFCSQLQVAGSPAPAAPGLVGAMTEQHVLQDHGKQHAHHQAEGLTGQQQRGDQHVHPAASVHATMISEGNGSESNSDADSEISSTRSGNSNSNQGGSGNNGANVGMDAEIVSQPCGASHSASPAPSASVPAAATATGPFSRSGVVSGAAGESRGLAGAHRDSSCALGADAAAAAAGGEMHQRQHARQAEQHGSHQAQQRQGQTTNSGQRGNQGDAAAQAQQQQTEQQQSVQHQPHDSSLAMATAGPTGTRSATMSTNSGTVDMSIHNESHKSGAGSQGEAPADERQRWGMADDYDEYAAGATNSRDGEARGEPPGAFETAESGGAAEGGYRDAPAHYHAHQHMHQHAHQVEQRHEHGMLPADSLLAAGYSAAEVATSLVGAAPSLHVALAPGQGDAFGAAAHPPVAHGQLGALADQQTGLLNQAAAVSALQPAAGSAVVAGGADALLLGSPSLQGGYSSSNVAGLAGVSGAEAAGGVATGHRRSSCAAVDAPGAEAGTGACAGDELDAGSSQQQLAAAIAAAKHVGFDNGSQEEPHQQPQPAAAQQIEQEPLCATLSVTSQLQPAPRQQQQGQAEHQQQRVHQPRRQQQQQPGCVHRGKMMPPASVITTASQPHTGVHHYGLVHPSSGQHAMLAQDAVPQFTEIHGHFADCQVPATAAAAQMAAAAAAAAAAVAAAGQPHASHPHGNASDVQPQVTEMHGMLGASAGTAAEAQLAAAAAAAAAAAHCHTAQHLRQTPSGTAAAAAAAAAAIGAAGYPGVVGEGRLPPLPHAHGGRAHSSHHRPHSGAGSRVGPVAGTSLQAAALHGGVAAHLASPPPMGPGGPGWCSSNQQHMYPPRSVSAEAPNPAAAHSRAHYSPPAVNFNPLPAAAGMLQGQGQGSAPVTGSGSGTGAVEGTRHAPTSGQQLVDQVDEQQQQQQGQHSTAPGDAAALAGGAVDGVGASCHVHAIEAPGSPSHAQGNSQLGQQDGSRGSPPAGMGRVGSVPPPEQHGHAGGQHQQGVVDQPVLPAVSGHTMSEGAGSHHRAAEQGRPQQRQHEQEADGPCHVTQKHSQHAVESKSAVTSPAHQRHHQVNGCTAATAAAAAGGAVSSHGHHLQPQLSAQPSQQLQQHWQHMQGAFPEGAGQVGGRASSMRFSYGQPEASVQPGISSKVYGSVSAGFASGSKAEGSPSYGAGMDGCSIGNAMASGADGVGYGHAAAYHQHDTAQHSGEAEGEVEVEAAIAAPAAVSNGGQHVPLPHQQQQRSGLQQAQSHSTRRPRSAEATGAAAAAAMQEGEGSYGSRSGEARSCKRRRTSCEAASVRQHMTSSMQTTEA